MIGNKVKFQGAKAVHFGFTLMEMLVVVAMVGILSAIALPSYQDYVVRGKLPEATANLAAKRVRLEQYFQDNHTYIGAPDCVTDNTTSLKFFYACTVEAATSFTLRADGKNEMTGFTFTIDESGRKATASVPTGWTLPSPNNCWVTKKGGVC